MVDGEDAARGATAEASSWRFSPDAISKWPGPARATVEAKLATPDYNVEIMMVAAK